MNNNLATIQEAKAMLKGDGFITEFKKICGGNLDVEREIAFAINIISDTPYLQKATISSVVRSIMSAAATGLTLNPIERQAYLIPRNKKNGTQYVTVCSLEPSYMGLISLAKREGAIKSINCQIVWEGDDIGANLGTNTIEHKPYMFTGKEKGSIKAAYAIVEHTNGGRNLEIMSYADLMEIRDRSESYKSYLAKKNDGKWAAIPTWISDEGEMIRKTVVKRVLKYVGKGEGTRLAEAIDADNEASGYNDMATFDQLSYLERLIARREPDMRTQQDQENMLNMTKKEASEAIQWYIDNPQEDELQQMIDKDNFKEERKNQ